MKWIGLSFAAVKFGAFCGLLLHGWCGQLDWMLEEFGVVCRCCIGLCWVVLGWVGLYPTGMVYGR